MQGWWWSVVIKKDDGPLQKKKPCVHHFDSMTGWIKMIHPPLTWQWPIRHLWSDRHLYVYKLNGWCLTRNPKSNCKDQLARGAQRQRPFSSWAKSQRIDPGLERQGLLMNMWCVYPTIFKYIYIYVCARANENNSLTWNLRPFWDDSSLKTMIPGFGRSEVVMKFTHIYIYLFIYLHIYPIAGHK